jgi:hypothetical protein
MVSSVLDVCHLGKSIPNQTSIFYIPSPFFSDVRFTVRLCVLNGFVRGIQNGILNRKFEENKEVWLVTLLQGNRLSTAGRNMNFLFLQNVQTSFVTQFTLYSMDIR